MPDIYRIRRVQLKKGEDEKPLCWRQMFFCFIGRYLHAGWINCFPKFNITDKAESTTVEIRIINHCQFPTYHNEKDSRNYHILIKTRRLSNKTINEYNVRTQLHKSKIKATFLLQEWNQHDFVS